jgi:RecA/RadA recombinase
MGFDKKKKAVKPTQELAKARFQDKADTLGTKFYRTGVLPLDLVTQGRGLPGGSMINLFSKPKFGKSTVMLDAISNMIEADPVYNATELLDIEGTSLVIAEGMGLMKDDSKFLYLRPSFYDDLQFATDAWFNAEEPSYRILCIDTISAVSPDLESIRQQGISKASVGLDARIRTGYLKLWHNMIKRTDKIMFIVTQVRANFNNAGWNASPDDMYKSEGGYATEHFFDLQIKFIGNSKLSSDDLNQDGSVGGVGKSGYMISEKNKFGVPSVKIPFDLIFGKGVSNLLFLKDYFLPWRGNVVSHGSSFVCTHPVTEEEVTVRGRAGLMQWIKDFYGDLKDDFYLKAPEFFFFLHIANKKKKEESGEEDEEGEEE